MAFLRTTFVFILSAALAVSPAFAKKRHHAAATASTTTTRSHKSGSLHSAHGSKKAAAQSKSHRMHGQQAIDPERVTQIQQALIREHYLTAEADGRWDATTIAAMQKFQADQGWQTKLMPDSRAIKKLGLGPDYSNAINAKNSSFAVPAAIGTTPTVQAAGFAEAAGVAGENR